VPALKATGRSVQERLKQAGAGGSGLKFGGVWTGVIVSQVAFTVLFLLIVGSVMWNVRIGRYGAPEVSFATENYLSVRLEMDRGTAPSAEAAQAFRVKAERTYRELERRLSAETGVAGVTYASALPGMIPPRLNLEADAPSAAPSAAPEDRIRSVRTAAVDAKFFDTFRIPVVLGRGFDARDVTFNRDVAIVDQSFVRFILGGGDPIGQRVRRAAEDDDDEPGPWMEIVGVVKDITVSEGKTAQDTVLYRPAGPGTVSPLHVAVHASDATALAPRLRTLAAEVDPTMRIYDLTPLNDVNRDSDIGVAFVGQILAVIGLIALLLSTVGVYSLMAFTVARRTREIGIRVALGADRRGIVTGTLSRALSQVALGIVAGSIPGSMVVAWGAPEIAQGAGAGIGAMALLIVGGFMIGVCALASLVPTRRALNIEPTEALRA
jgi:hypothetical protein